MVLPPFLIRISGNNDEAHLVLDFGNQPNGKIPSAIASQIPILEKRLAAYMQ